MVVSGGLGVTETDGFGGADDALAVAGGAVAVEGAVAEEGSAGCSTGAGIAPIEDEGVTPAAGSGAGLSVLLQATGSKAPSTSTPAAMRRDGAEDAPQNGQDGSVMRA